MVGILWCCCCCNTESCKSYAALLWSSESRWYAFCITSKSLIVSCLCSVETTSECNFLVACLQATLISLADELLETPKTSYRVLAEEEVCTVVAPPETALGCATAPLLKGSWRSWQQEDEDDDDDDATTQPSNLCLQNKDAELEKLLSLLSYPPPFTPPTLLASSCCYNKIKW